MTTGLVLFLSTIWHSVFMQPSSNIANHKIMLLSDTIFSSVSTDEICIVLKCNLHSLSFISNFLFTFQFDFTFFLQVYDWDKSSRNDFLGCTRLNLGGRTGKWDDALGPEREAWQKLINEPNVRHEFVIPLRSSTETRPFEE